MGRSVGIDLGTTNSVIAIYEAGGGRVLINDEGQRLTPSVVSFTEDGEVLVGASARRQAVSEPTRTISSIKRLMGRRFSSLDEDSKEVGAHVVEAPNGDAAIEIDGERYGPADLSARILVKLKQAAEIALGEDVTAAVITVPAYFDDAQRRATRAAGQIAGLEVPRIINEPTAASLAYEAGSDGDARVVVFDFGGGTFDVSVLEIEAGVVDVLATAGDTALGGDDIDHRIAGHLRELFERENGRALGDDPVAAQRLRTAAEQAKIELSHAKVARIELPFLAAGDEGPLHLKVRLTRSELERMIADLIGRTIACCERALRDAGIDRSEVDDVLLVGGSTRIPLVRERVEAFFGRSPNATINPDEVVALGAARQAAILSGEADDVLLLDVIPLSLGVETRGGLVARLLERNSTIPTRARRTFSTTVDNQSAVAVHVVQGEHELADRNRSLGTFELSDIPPMPRGRPKVEVSFDIDANGTLSVSAHETQSGRQASVQIDDAGGIDDDEIERLSASLEREGRAAQAISERLTARDGLDRQAIQVGARLEELRDELRPATRKETEAALQRATELLEAKEAPVEDLERARIALIDLLKTIEDTAIAAGARARDDARAGAGEPAEAPDGGA